MRALPLLLLLPAVALAETPKLDKTYDPFAPKEAAAPSPADPEDAEQVAMGGAIYAEYCAACHGADLEGDPEWRVRDEDGGYKPPPHDDSGHTWHHSDKVLFDYTKLGGEKLFEEYPNIVSRMPGFGDMISDAEIWAVLAYIKSHWSPENRDAQSQASAFDPLPEGDDGG